MNAMNEPVQTVWLNLFVRLSTAQRTGLAVREAMLREMLARLASEFPGELADLHGLLPDSATVQVGPT